MLVQVKYNRLFNIFKKAIKKMKMHAIGCVAIADYLFVVLALRHHIKSPLFLCSVAEYYTLCPGGEGFRPNPITIILEGEHILILTLT